MAITLEVLQTLQTTVQEANAAEIAFIAHLSSALGSIAASVAVAITLLANDITVE